MNGRQRTVLRKAVHAAIDRALDSYGYEDVIDLPHGKIAFTLTFSEKSITLIALERETIIPVSGDKLVP